VDFPKKSTTKGFISAFLEAEEHRGFDWKKEIREHTQEAPFSHGYGDGSDCIAS
jgi:hypothetical protein